MIYFKKKVIKEYILKIYKIFNSILVKFNCLFLINKNSNIKVFFGGSVTGNVGVTLVKIKRLKKKFQNNNFNFNCVYLLSNSIYLNKSAIKDLKKKNIPIIHNQNGVFYKGWYGDGWETKNSDMSFQLHSADYVFYQSNFSKYCSEIFLGKREGPEEVLYNAVDTKFFRPHQKKVLQPDLKILITGKYQEHLYYSLEFSLKVLFELNKCNIPSSIILPSLIRIILLVILPISSEWVTSTNVCLSFLFNSTNNLMISDALDESKFPVGSSAHTIAGSLERALAIATLCCCPPDNSVGRCFALSAKPTRSSFSKALLVAFF